MTEAGMPSARLNKRSRPEFLGPFEDDLVFDVGMNNGDDTAYYLHLGYRVVGVEAHPGLASAAAKRFRSEIEAGRLTILNVAIAESDGELPFWVCESKSEWSSFDKSIAGKHGSPHHRITVQARRFESIVREYGLPYYLKIDIEGSDMLCIGGLKAGQLPAYLSIELGAAVVERLALFRDLGFVRFKCVSQFYYLPVQRPSSLDEQTYGKYWIRLAGRSFHWRVFRRLGARRMLLEKLRPLRTLNGWIFPGGASGPFGEDTRGKWLSFDELSQTLEHFQSEFRARRPSPFWGHDPDSFWADLHMASVPAHDTGK